VKEMMEQDKIEKWLGQKWGRIILDANTIDNGLGC
jgi:hypothetical protein